MEEDTFVGIALEVAQEILQEPYTIKRKASLLYQVNLDNKLNITINPRRPKRGQSAFQTDLCIFEKIRNDIEIPRVVLEFKKSLSTHDVLIYNSKAARHKEIYPYLRYGFIIGNEHKVPGRFIKHNRSLDFCIAAKNYRENSLEQVLSKIFKDEIKVSRLLESLSFEKKEVDIFRMDLKVFKKST